jgi:hypothetical protein
MNDLVLGPGFHVNPNIATRRTILLGQPDTGKTNGLTVIANAALFPTGH